MKFFFDNNISHHIAHAMRELSRQEPAVEEVVHLADKFARNSPDLEWIPALTASGPWSIVTLDKLKKQSGAEREALRRAGHMVFLLESQWTKQSFWLQAERLTKWWPQVVQQAGIATGGAFVVPWHHSSKSKFKVVKL